MKAISIRQPYAHFIMCGKKDIECRSWQTSYRGDLLICASANPKIKNTIPGHALCVARLDSIESFTKDHLDRACMSDMPDGKAYAWHFTDLRLIEPFPVKGKLNFFEVPNEKIKILRGGGAEFDDEDAVNAFYDQHIGPYIYKGK